VDFFVLLLPHEGAAGEILARLHTICDYSPIYTAIDKTINHGTASHVQSPLLKFKSIDSKTADYNDLLRV
jgi:hypothetical protein